MVSGLTVMAISKAMFEAGLKPSRRLADASEPLLMRDVATKDAAVDPADLAMQISEGCGGDPFMMNEALLSGSHIGSTALRAAVTLPLLTAPAAPVREAAALGVLDPDRDERRATAAALVEECRGITPVTLRRLIAIRRWIAEPERGLIDQAVKAARLAGVDCAQWTSGAEVAEIHATVPDGAGSQAAMIVTRAGRGFQLSGLLFKQHHGIADAWTMAPESRSAIRQMLKRSHSGFCLLPAPRSHLDRLVAYYLRCGLDQNVAPPARLLAVAELLQAPQWQPGDGGWQQLLMELIAEVPARLLAPDSVRSIVASSAKWAMNRRWSATWAEEGQKVSDLLDGLQGHPMERVLDKILEEVLEKRRTIWAERFTLTAASMKEATSREHLPWEKFAIMAQKLVEEVPLREIPMMSEIAGATAFL
jgi:hypothetical protein